MSGPREQGRPPRRKLDGRLAALKRAVVAGAIACFAAVGIAAGQGSAGTPHAASSTGSSQRTQGSGVDSTPNGFWDEPAGGTATLGGGSTDAPVAGSHAS